MKTCYVDYDTRSIADLCRPGELYRGWTITRVNVPEEHRGRGLGTKILSEILADADADGAELWLDIHPSGALGYDELAKWYTRHGFKMINAYGTMRRTPRTSFPNLLTS